MLFVCTSRQPECPNFIYLFIYLFTLHYHGKLQLALYIYTQEDKIAVHCIYRTSYRNFYLILRKWPQFVNSAIFAADSIRCHGNSFKRRQLAGHLRSMLHRNTTKKISQQHSHFRSVLAGGDPKCGLTIGDYAKQSGKCPPAVSAPLLLFSFHSLSGGHAQLRLLLQTPL